MAFKNEYAPPLDQPEPSEFFREARKTLRKGHTNFDRWTVDRQREMVLTRKGSGREVASSNEEFWAFIDHKGHYVFDTLRLSRTERLPDEVAISYRLDGFWGDQYSTPDLATLACIKEALREHGRWHIFNAEGFKRCELTLIDHQSGKEI